MSQLSMADLLSIHCRFTEIKYQQQASNRGKNLYIKRLPLDMDDNGLRKLFSKFGNITSAKVRVVTIHHVNRTMITNSTCITNAKG